MTISRVALSLLGLPGLLLCADMPEQPKNIIDNGKAPFAATGEDITRLPTRLGLAYDSIVNDEKKSNNDRYLATGSIAILGLQAQAEIPLLDRHNPGIGNTVSGFGDILASGSYALPMNPKMRITVGLDMSLDTASRDELGAGENIYTPFFGAGIQMDDRDMAVIKLSYTKGTESDLKHFDVLLRGLHRWDERLFTAVDVVPGWNINDNKFTFRTRGVVGAQIDPHHLVSAETGQPLDSAGRDANGWDLRINYSYVF